jgi:hypothetical protein
MAPLSIGIGISPVMGTGGGVSPVSILGSSLLSWWTTDRSDLITLSGSAVTSWKDVKNGYDAAQAVSGSRPAYSTTSFDGVPGVTFDGVDDCLEMVSQPFATGAVDLELWATVQQDAALADATGKTMFSFGGATDTVQVRASRIVSTISKAGGRVGNGSATFVALAAEEFQSRAIVRLRVTPTATYASLNGGAEVSVAVVPAAGSTRVRIGANADNTAGSFWNGKIRDILVTNPLSVDQAAQLQAWALSRIPAYDADALALFSRFTTPATVARKGLISDLIKSLKSAGVWSKLDVLYVMAAADSQAARRNWIQDLYNATAVSSPTFVADRGYTGDGAASYNSSGYTPSTNGVKYLLNDASHWLWSRTAAQSAAIDAGNGSGGRITIATRNTSDQFAGRINDTTLYTPANTDGTGFFGMCRSASNARKGFRNGVVLSTSGAASTAVPAEVIWIGGSNPGVFSTRQIAAQAMGGNLSDAEALAFYNALQTYMTAVGA